MGNQRIGCGGGMENTMKEQYMKIPAVALRGMAILPGMVAHFDVSRSVSVRAVEAAMMGEQTVFLVTQKNIEKEDR